MNIMTNQEYAEYRDSIINCFSVNNGYQTVEEVLKSQGLEAHEEFWQLCRNGGGGGKTRVGLHVIFQKLHKNADAECKVALQALYDAIYPENEED